MTREQRGHFTGGAQFDPAMTIHGSGDVIAKAVEAGADYRVDPRSGKVTVITEDGQAARFPGDQEYSYTMQRKVWQVFAIIGLALFMVIFMAASCGV